MSHAYVPLAPKQLSVPLAKLSYNNHFSTTLSVQVKSVSSVPVHSSCSRHPRVSHCFSLQQLCYSSCRLSVDRSFFYALWTFHYAVGPFHYAVGPFHYAVWTFHCMMIVITRLTVVHSNKLFIWPFHYPLCTDLLFT